MSYAHKFNHNIKFSHLLILSIYFMKNNESSVGCYPLHFLDNEKNTPCHKLEHFEFVWHSAFTISSIELYIMDHFNGVELSVSHDSVTWRWCNPREKMKPLVERYDRKNILKLVSASLKFNKLTCLYVCLSGSVHASFNRHTKKTIFKKWQVIQNTFKFVKFTFLNPALQTLRM